MKVLSKGFEKRGVLAFLLVVLFSGQELFAATRYHRIAWDSDPSSNAVIGFSPDGASTSPWIEYGFTTDDTLWTSLSSLNQETFAGTLVSYFGRLTGLPANSPVYFKVCDPESGCGQLFWFKTAPNDNARLSLLPVVTRVRAGTPAGLAIP